MRKLLLAALFTVTPLSAGFGVIPLVQCADFDPFTNSLVVHWNWYNTNSFEVTVDNAFNFFVPGPGNRDQAVSFPPGLGTPFITVSGAGSSITWVLGEFYATASTNSPTCQYGIPLACWDKNGNGVCDPSEDIDGDGKCDLLDCQGAPGPQGATGPQGSPGATGAAGATGSSLSGATRLATVATGAVTATASCGSNEFMVSGGGSCTVPGSQPAPGRIATNQPASVSSWTVTCSTGQATAVAMCSVKQ